MNLIYDDEYNYEGYHGVASKCGLKIYGDEERFVVIMTELPNNPGTSVTNRSEHIAMRVADMICHRYATASMRPVAYTTMWIEHYPADSIRRATYNRVRYTDKNREYTSPQWSPMAAREWIAMGIPIPDDVNPLNPIQKHIDVYPSHDVRWNSGNPKCFTCDVYLGEGQLKFNATKSDK